MTKSNVFHLSQPGDFADLLTEVLREQGRGLPMRAVEAEVARLLENGGRSVAQGARATLLGLGHGAFRRIA